MILDSLSQWRRYAAISPRFERAFVFLQQVTNSTKVGRHEISGDDVFALVQQHNTRHVSERQYESHRTYIDVQYIQRGRELMYWAPLPLLTNVTMPFDVKQDAALYGLIPEGVPLPMRVGQFAIFFPEDGHIPSCAWDQPAEVLKVVVKVRVLTDGGIAPLDRLPAGHANSVTAET
jgi:YhcH/YjgK/YiaL family protein